MTTVYQQQGRPIAGLPQHHQQRQQTQTATAPAPRPAAPAPSYRSPYAPNPAELHGGGRNRLMLALRSGIESEVDWALPRLILASFDQPDAFKLDAWPDSVNALLVHPLRWLDELEKEAALFHLRRGAGPGQAAGKLEYSGGVLGIVSDWTRDTELETRAVNCLLILRNASFTATNAQTIFTTSKIDHFLLRLFSLPSASAFILELSLRQPEILQHVFVLVQWLFPYLANGKHRAVLVAMTRTLSSLAIDTRDAGVLHNALPILVAAYQLPTPSSQSVPGSTPLPPADLIPYLLKTLTLAPPTSLLELSIDLLISLTQNSAHSRTVLADPSFPAHLRNMVILLEHSSRRTAAAWESPGHLQGMLVPNPASTAGLVEQAAKRRRIEREQAQRQMELNPMSVQVEVGDRPPSMSLSVKKKLLAMKEPARSLQWMHENFVYCSDSSILQITFWHAYRDFFSNAPSSDPMLSASDVIKNVTVAFSCASAKVIQDPLTGQNKFVIWGLGWRKGSDETQRFNCAWTDCPQPSGHTDAVRLLDHVRSTHLAPSATTCAWASCRHSPLTLSHICTHLPLTYPVPVPDMVTIHPSMSMYDHPLSSSTGNLTHRPPAPLGRQHKLQFTATVTPADQRRHPIGVAYLTSLLLRNLARTLSTDLASALPPDAALTQEAKDERRRHLQEERFGLPIPDNVLREEEEEEQQQRAGAGAGAGEVGPPGAMRGEQRERARLAFDSVEPRVLEVVEGNMSGLSAFLGECFGFGALAAAGW